MRLVKRMAFTFIVALIIAVSGAALVFATTPFCQKFVKLGPQAVQMCEAIQQFACSQPGNQNNKMCQGVSPAS